VADAERRKVCRMINDASSFDAIKQNIDLDTEHTTLQRVLKHVSSVEPSLFDWSLTEFNMEDCIVTFHTNWIYVETIDEQALASDGYNCEFPCTQVGALFTQVNQLPQSICKMGGYQDADQLILKMRQTDNQFDGLTKITCIFWKLEPL